MSANHRKRKPGRAARQWFEKCNYNCLCWDNTRRTYAMSNIVGMLRRIFNGGIGS